MAKSKLAKRRIKRKRNPVEKSDAMNLAYSVGAGFSGYAATRLISRIAFSQAVKKFPGAAKHTAVLASAAGAAAAYFGSKNWSKVSEYHEEITIGAGIAVMQSAMQAYLPQYSWIVGDLDEKQYAPKKAKAPSQDFSLPPPPDEFDAPALPESTGGFDLDALLAEHGLEEGEQVGRLSEMSDYNDAHEHGTIN